MNKTGTAIGFGTDDNTPSKEPREVNLTVKIIYLFLFKKYSCK